MHLVKNRKWIKCIQHNFFKYKADQIKKYGKWCGKRWTGWVLVVHVTLLISSVLSWVSKACISPYRYDRLDHSQDQLFIFPSWILFLYPVSLNLSSPSFSTSFFRLTLYASSPPLISPEQVFAPLLRRDQRTDGCPSSLLSVSYILSVHSLLGPCY